MIFFIIFWNCLTNFLFDVRAKKLNDITYFCSDLMYIHNELYVCEYIIDVKFFI